MTKFKKELLLAFLITILFSCTKSTVVSNNSGEAIREFNTFTPDDFERIKNDVAQISKSINFATIKTKALKKVQDQNRNNSEYNLQSNCGSYLAEQYSTTCFTGHSTEYFIEENPNTGPSSHTGLFNNLDLTVSNGFSDFGSSNNDPNYFLVQNQLSTNLGSIMSALGTEQSNFADSLQNITTLSDLAADQLMTDKLIEQQNRIINNHSLSYEDKEYILTTLELQLQNKENYMMQFESTIENSQSRRRTFLGKLWRGLAFVAITLATAGKAAVFVAKAAHIVAGKSALWAAGGAAIKKAYFAIGVAAAWIPTGRELIYKEKWNYNPWGSGSFSDILKLGSGIIGVVTNPLFGWTIL